MAEREKLAIFGGTRTVPEGMKEPQWPWLSDDDVAVGCEAIKRAQSDELYLSSARGEGIMQEFEENLARFVGVKHCVSTSGGGPALHIAVAAAGVQAGDEVIVTPYTWGQSVGCALQQLAIPVFADIDPVSYTLDPASIEKKITPRTKAIVVVHLYGQPADMDEIMELARRHGLAVIEDCAQAEFARYKGRRVGSIGDIGCFSMGSGKNLIGGEGGALVTDNEIFYKRAVAFGMHPGRFRKVIKGVPELENYASSMIYTYRSHPLYCVLANNQLKRVDEMNEWRRKNCEHLAAGLAGLKLVRPPAVKPDREHVYHIFCAEFQPEAARGLTVDEYSQALKAEGVKAGKGYVGKPFHLQGVFRDKHFWYGKGLPWSLVPESEHPTYREGDCPVAERLCAGREMFISSGPWYRDVRPMLDRWIQGFRKVEENLEELVRRREELAELAVS